MPGSRWCEPKSKASHASDKNGESVFKQRSALARLWAHLRDEVRNRAGRAGKDALFCVFAIGQYHLRWHLANR